jgi:hypothetical protein
MGNNSEGTHSLAKEVKLSAHGRHPTTYLFTSCCFIVALNYFLIVFQVSVIVVFSGTKGYFSSSLGVC